MLITRDKSQLLIIDVQEKLIEAISGKDRVIDRCVRLVRAARALGVPITISEQYPQGLGPTADSIRDAFANAGVVVDKVEFSCLKNDPLRERLHELRREGRVLLRLLRSCHERRPRRSHHDPRHPHRHVHPPRASTSYQVHDGDSRRRD